MMLHFFLQMIILALFAVFRMEQSGRGRAELEFVLPITPIGCGYSLTLASQIYYHFEYVGHPRSYKWTNSNSLVTILSLICPRV
jgi:hypothetical protein